MMQNYDLPGLLGCLLAKELKAKYKNTLIGYAWSVLMPLFQSLIFFIVFSLFLRFAIKDYFLFLLIGCVVWQFFSNALTQGANSLIANANLIRKTCVPRWIFPVASVGAEGVHLLLSLPVLALLMCCCGRSPHWSACWLLPAGAFSLGAMGTGMALITASLNARFRDLERILQLVTQVWFYATPIFYSMEQIPEQHRWLLKLNPVYYPVMLFRSVFYEPGMGIRGALAGIVIGSGILLSGMLFFHCCRKNLAEVL